MNTLENKHTEKLTKLLYMAFAVAAVTFVLPKVVPCLLPFFFAWIISLIIKPFVSLFEKLKIHKRIAVILSMLLVLGILSVVVYYLSKAVVEELRTFAEMFRDTKDGIPVFVWEFIGSLPKSIQKIALNFIEKYKGNTGELVMPAISTALPKLGDIVGGIPSAFVFTIVFLLTIYFLSYDEKGLKEELKKFLPENVVGTLRKMRAVMGKAIGGYVRAQMIIMVVVFVVLLSGFLILDVKFALLLAFVISLMDAIPVLGTGMVLNPMAVLSLVQGDYICAVGFVSMYIIVLLVRNFMEPRVLSVQLGMHPIITLLSMYAGFKLIGVVGMLMGPIIALIAISFVKMEKEESVKDGIGQHDSNCR